MLHLLPSRRSVPACLIASQFPKAKPERQAPWSYSRVSVCIIHGVIPSTKARHVARPQVSEWKGLQRAWPPGSFHTLGPQLQQSAVIATLSQEDSGELADRREERKLRTAGKRGRREAMAHPSALPCACPLSSSLHIHMEALGSPREGGESAGLGPAGLSCLGQPLGIQTASATRPEASISPKRPSALWVEPEANDTQQAAGFRFPGHSQ